VEAVHVGILSTIPAPAVKRGDDDDDDGAGE